MAESFIGEIRMVGFSFPPVGWLTCDGSLQQISQYDTLYALIGTTYGGDGQNTFGLPDFRGKVPLFAGSGGGGNYALGQQIGTESVTLLSAQVGLHNHPLVATNDGGNSSSPAGGYPANSGGTSVYTADTAAVTALNPQSILNSTGGGGPHNNVAPYQCLNFIISVEGIYPSQN